MQIQISKINNGWVVMTPPEPVKLSRMTANEAQAQQHPVTQFCEDYDTVSDYIKRFFDLKIS